MLHHIHKHTVSIKHAFDGVVWAFQTQPNYRVHFLCSIAALIGAVFFNVSYIEFLILVLVILLGLVIETINTAIEQATDAIDLSIREDIRIAKDVSAGAMLIYAVGSIILVVIIFVPKIINQLL